MFYVLENLEYKTVVEISWDIMKECHDLFLLVMEIYSLYIDLTAFVVIAMFYIIKISDTSWKIHTF